MTRRRRDRGAAALIVTLLFSSGVLLGCAALTVDVGQLYSERRQLQNGADAAALSLAKVCATSGTCSYAGADAAALGNNRISLLNNANAKDDYAAFNAAFNVTYDNGLCGRATTLPNCAAPNGTLLDCPALPSWLTANAAIPFVEVHNLTQTDSSGNHILPTAFGRAVTGFNGAAVSSCSRVAWGSPGGVGRGNIPITVSGCDWMHATGGTIGGGGGSYYPSPVYGTPGGSVYGYGGAGQPAWPAAAATPPAQNAGGEVILLVQNPPAGQTMPTACPTWQGHALPGGFGILETQTSPPNPCLAEPYAYDWMHTSPGNNVGCDLAPLVGTVIYVPVFDCTASYLYAGVPPVPGEDCTMGNGSNAWYHRAGYAAFYLSGYNVTVTGSLSNKHKSLVSNQFPCNGGESCISGWFVSGQLQSTYPSGPPSGGGFFGTYTINPAG
jgi:hypothetical protein